MSTDALMVEGAVPLDVSSDSQDCVFEAVQSRVPPPVLAIATGCAAGLLPPTVALKVNDRGLTERTGLAVMVSVTGIVTGDPDAPVALMVMVSW